MTSSSDARRPRSVSEILADARAGHPQVPVDELAERMAAGAHVIDIRSPVTRDPEGHVPGAVVVERLVLEWRLDPSSPWRMEGWPDLDDEVIVMCNEGYSSSLAARDLRELGFHRATDLEGGFRAWAAAGHRPDPAPTRWVR